MTKEELAKLEAKVEADELTDDDLELVAGGATRAQLMESFAIMKSGGDCPYFNK